MIVSFHKITNSSYDYDSAIHKFCSQVNQNWMLNAVTKACRAIGKTSQHFSCRIQRAANHTRQHAPLNISIAATKTQYLLPYR